MSTVIELMLTLAKQDVEPFILDPSMLDLWSADFFKQITEGLTIC